ncbi:MAG: TonB family protein [Bacteroidota bacterium]
MKHISKFCYTLIVLIIVCTSLSTKSQSIADTTIFTFVELMPRYPGGNSTMHNFINTTINYPSTAILNNVTGKVYVSIVVETDGRLSNIKVLKGIGSGCDEEAARIVSLMPNWNPGVHEEKNVRVSTTIPITFKKIKKTDGPIHNNAHVLPLFTQSSFDFDYYVNTELMYPAGISKEDNIDTVDVLYVVETDGSLSNVTLLDSSSSFNAFDFEAIRIVKELSGKFEPGYINDMPVRVRLMVSVVFDYNEVDTLDCELK